MSDSLQVESLFQVLYWHFNNRTDSIHYYARLLAKEAEAKRVPIGLSRSYNMSGRQYMRESQLDSAAYYFEKAHKVAVDLGEELQASMIMANLGIVRYNLGDFEGALESFLVRLRMVEKIPRLKKSEANWLNNIAGVYTRLNRDSLAIVYARKSLRIRQELNEVREVVGSMITLSAVYVDAEMFDSSYYYSKKAFHLSRSINNELTTVQALNNMALYFERQEAGDLDSAIYYMNTGIRLAQKQGFTTDLANFQLNLSKIYNQRENYRKALETASGAAAYYEETGLKRELSIAKGNLADAYEGLGRYKEANEVLRGHYTLRDSLFNIDKSEAISELQIEYETEKKNQQIALQESQLETSAAIISRQSLVRNIAIGGAAVLILVVILIYRNNRLKTQAAQEISEKNVQLGKALSERESLLKEIHHRVKNNLQVIASLLYLQSDKTDDVSVKKLLEEGQGRVRSMALIHQKLYENDDLKHIPFEDYLSELVGEIKKTFGAAAEGVDLHIEAKNIQFDVDTAVPLGLIINELSTNAFKYAYTDKMGGALFSVKLEQNEGQYEMTVSDNGTGIPDEALNATQSSSLGLRLTRMLSDQLEGEYTFDNKEGTSFTLKFAV